MAPTLTAAVQQQTRVLLSLTWAGITQATIQRLDPDGVLRNVRNAEPIACFGSCAVFDHEAPLDQAVTYQATSPDGTGTVITDAFGRTVSGGWGTADTGQSYTVSSNAADFTVGSGVGKISMSTTGDERLVWANLGASDFDVTADVSVAALPATNTWGTGVCGRVTDANNNYNSRVVVTTAGAMTLQINKRVLGSQSLVASVALSTTYVGGTVYRLRFRGSGVNLMAKVWLASATEPGPWTLTTTDTSLTTGNNAGGFARNDTAATTHVWSYDNLVANSLAPLTVTASPVTVASNGQAWLTHPGHPQYAGAASVPHDGLSEIRPARRGVFAPIGTSLPVVVNDVRGGSSGTLAVQTNTAADITRLRNMLADGSPLLLRQPLAWGGDSWWVSVGDAGTDRITNRVADGWRRWTLPFQRVDRPTGLSDGAVGQTWADVKSTYANWTALTATGKTWTALATSVT